MPRIAEMRSIDGDTWVRVEVTGDEGSISLYTPEEVEAIRRDERKSCADIADEVASRYGVAGASAQVAANQIRNSK